MRQMFRHVMVLHYKQQACAAVVEAANRISTPESWTLFNCTITAHHIEDAVVCHHVFSRIGGLTIVGFDSDAAAVQFKMTLPDSVKVTTSLEHPRDPVEERQLWQGIVMRRFGRVIACSSKVAECFSKTGSSVEIPISAVSASREMVLIVEHDVTAEEIETAAAQVGPRQVLLLTGNVPPEASVERLVM